MRHKHLTAALCILLSGLTVAIFSGHYKFNDPIPVRVSNVAPFHNPTEKYPYDLLPWPCKPKDIHSDNPNLGAIINGERNRDSLYQIHFQRSTNKQTVCGEKELQGRDVNAFIDAINDEYQYEMWVDDLPVFGRVGFAQPNEMMGGKLYFLITHRHFHIRYNKDQVITVNISTRLQPGHYVEIKKDTPLEQVHFTYSVAWSPTEIQYSERWEEQMQSNPTRYQVEAHWLWVLNSSLLVVLLTGLLSMILLRTLKNDVARYLQVDQIDQEEMAQSRQSGIVTDVDDSGWKRIRSDVFRAPSLPYLFSSIVGIGAQILMIAFFLLTLAVIGYFYPGNHGRIYVAAIFLYSFTAYIAGYISSSKLKELVGADNHDWMVSCGITSSLFAGPYLIIFSIVNSIAAYHKSSIALPFATIVAIILLWAFVTFPLTAFGAYRGGKCLIDPYPCHVKKIRRPLPDSLPWYHNNILLALTAGFLPFMAIYVEVHTIFMSVWGHQPYTLFGILLLTFVILLIVTSFVVILMCYFQLTAEDYRWWWSSLIRGSACGIFMYAYAVYYWFYTAQMSGSLQFTMYFGYTFMVSYACCLMLAAVGHWSSRWFVIRIYNAIKSD